MTTNYHFEKKLNAIILQWVDRFGMVMLICPP